MGSLIEATNGKLYGLTSEGGLNGSREGVLFEYDYITDNFSKKVEFDRTTMGAEPEGMLVETSNGKLYGMTKEGGANDFGVLFEYDITLNNFSKKIDFDDEGHGKYPYGSLIQASNGKLYGMTHRGGNTAEGTLFEYSISSNTLTKEFDFNGALNGELPKGSLVLAPNGKFYGMTEFGGLHNRGVIFEIDPSSNAYEKKVDLEQSSGAYPNGNLMLPGDGYLYGLTSEGGNNDLGTIVQYDYVSNSLTKVADFNGTGNGSEPLGSLIQISNGLMYGLTNKGGNSDYGVIFEFDPAIPAVTKRIDFNGSSRGKWPIGRGLTQKGFLTRSVFHIVADASQAVLRVRPTRPRLPCLQSGVDTG